MRPTSRPWSSASSPDTSRIRVACDDAAVADRPDDPRRTAAQQAGDAAETLVATRLADAGWTVLARNVHVGRHELDLVAIDPGPPAALVIVEVRWRADRDFGLAGGDRRPSQARPGPGSGLRADRPRHAAGRSAGPAPAVAVRPRRGRARRQASDITGTRCDVSHSDATARGHLTVTLPPRSLHGGTP